ncbi:hypothetical protein A0H81_13354 [Grifola frondosa]|uniref:Uncharacterized protein n=1 Tax=Grifola frondosa TaxID=5627 RepID=A0A1C7LRK4_GRIFR|nr:hypothetical protein A0H81_13354 [Grifola frondosa]
MPSNKVNTHPTSPPLQPIPAAHDARPFSTLTMDFVTDLPESEGFDSLLVVVDHDVTKGIVLTPCNKTIDAIGTADLLHRNVYDDTDFQTESFQTEDPNSPPRYSRNGIP